MSYRVQISPEAQKEIKELPGYTRAHALQLLRDIRDNPRLPRAKELRNKPDIFRLWLSKKWRIVYQIDDSVKQVLVLRVRRKEHIDYDSL